MKSILTGILAMFVVGLMPMIGLADWDTKEEAERGCVCASRYGVEAKCYVCKGVGYLKRVKYGYRPNGGMGRGLRKEYFVQCPSCAAKKAKWEAKKTKKLEAREQILAQLNDPMKCISSEGMPNLFHHEIEDLNQVGKVVTNVYGAYIEKWTYRADEYSNDFNKIITNKVTICFIYEFSVLSVVDANTLLLIGESKSGYSPMSRGTKLNIERLKNPIMVKTMHPHGLVDGDKFSGWENRKFRYIGTSEYISAIGAKKTVRTFEEI